MAETRADAKRKALDAARTTLALNGVVVTCDAAPRAGRVTGEDLGDRLLAHVGAHSGQRGEEIAEALGTDTYSMRPSMKRLIEGGQVRTEGTNRGVSQFGARCVGRWAGLGHRHLGE
jgi:predicted ArsR family transcriptional regulator